MKKKINDGFNTIPENQQEHSGYGKGILFCIALVLLFLIILMILIRMDVGGFGTKVLRPILKDVPIVNHILPEPTDEEIAAETGYKSLSQAVERIAELEAELEQLQNAASGDATQNTADSAEIERLKQQIATLQVYEKNQKTFESTKEKFYREVVYNDNVDVSEYTKWYESMDKDTAAKLYKEAVQTQEASEKDKDMAESYAKMKPEQAAAALESMSGDLDTVVRILGAMSAQERGEIMGEMTPNFAAKITKKMTS